MLKLAVLATCAIGLAGCQPSPGGELATGAAGAALTSDASAQAGGEGTQAQAQAYKVLSFAQGACGDCHAVEQPHLSPNPEAPPFAEIANRDGLSATTLSVWLKDAHNFPEAMDFDLESTDAEELTAYILTLQDGNYERPNY